MNNEKVTTIEATSKGWKVVILTGGLMFVAGVVSACSHPVYEAACAMLAELGIVLYIVGKIGAWWNHG